MPSLTFSARTNDRGTAFRQRKLSPTSWQSEGSRRVKVSEHVNWKLFENSEIHDVCDYLQQCNKLSKTEKNKQVKS